MVDTDGQALKLQAHSVGIQDRDSAGPLLAASRSWWPFVQLGYADAGCERRRQNPSLKWPGCPVAPE